MGGVEQPAPGLQQAYDAHVGGARDDDPVMARLTSILASIRSARRAMPPGTHQSQEEELDSALSIIWLLSPAAAMLSPRGADDSLHLHADKSNVPGGGHCSPVEHGTMEAGSVSWMQQSQGGWEEWPQDYGNGCRAREEDDISSMQSRSCRNSVKSGNTNSSSSAASSSSSACPSCRSLTSSYTSSIVSASACPYCRRSSPAAAFSQRGKGKKVRPRPVSCASDDEASDSSSHGRRRRQEHKDNKWVGRLQRIKKMMTFHHRHRGNHQQQQHRYRSRRHGNQHHQHRRQYQRRQDHRPPPESSNKNHKSMRTRLGAMFPHSKKDKHDKVAMNHRVEIVPRPVNKKHCSRGGGEGHKDVSFAGMMRGRWEALTGMLLPKKQGRGKRHVGGQHAGSKWTKSRVSHRVQARKMHWWQRFMKCHAQ